MATAEGLADRDLQVEMLRVAHAINRRTSVWKPVWQNANAGDTQNRSDQVRSEVETDCGESPKRSPWSDRNSRQRGTFRVGVISLLLDELAEAASPRHNGGTSRSVIAQRLLSRLDWHALEAEHMRWMRRDSIMNLAAAIRPWTQSAVDFSELLRQVERQESDSIDLATIDIASAVQSLRFSENPHTSAVAKALDVHYRNANVRFALSESMLNRLLPAVAPKSVPLRTTVLGTQVRGISHINSNLNVALTPASDQWTIEFQNQGNVQTRSTGLKGLFPFARRARTVFLRPPRSR